MINFPPNPQLTPYTELLSWLRRADRVTKGSKYEDVLKEYFTVMREMYTTELLGLVEYIKSTVWEGGRGSEEGKRNCLELTPPHHLHPLYPASGAQEQRQEQQREPSAAKRICDGEVGF